MITILAMGQSNAFGNQTGGNATFDGNLEVWDNENGRTDLNVLGSAFVAPVLGNDPFNPAGSNTMMVQAANNIAIYTGDTVRLILVATGSQAITQWADSSGNKGAMYLRMQAVLAAAGVTAVDIFLWHQGEADNGASGSYATRWGHLLSNLITDGYITISTPIVIGETAYQYTSINPVLRTIAANDSRVAIAPVSTFATADSTHFTGKAQDRIGLSYARVLSDMPGHAYGGILDEAGAKPHFSAIKALSQSLTSGAYNKITFPSVERNQGGHYDAANSRWTPPKGLVKITASCAISGLTNGSTLVIVIYKDGAELRLTRHAANSTVEILGIPSFADETNGNSYYEVYVYAVGSPAVTYALEGTWFQGELAV